MDYARSLVADLMAPLEQEQKKRYWDDDVCKHYLVGKSPLSSRQQVSPLRSHISH